MHGRPRYMNGIPAENSRHTSNWQPLYLVKYRVTNSCATHTHTTCVRENKFGVSASPLEKKQRRVKTDSIYKMHRMLSKRLVVLKMRDVAIPNVVKSAKSSNFAPAVQKNTHCWHWHILKNNIHGARYWKKKTKTQSNCQGCQLEMLSNLIGIVLVYVPLSCLLTHFEWPRLAQEAIWLTYKANNHVLFYAA